MSLVTGGRRSQGRTPACCMGRGAWKNERRGADQTAVGMANQTAVRKHSRARAFASWQALRASPCHHKASPTRGDTASSIPGCVIASIGNNRATQEDKRGGAHAPGALGSCLRRAAPCGGRRGGFAHACGVDLPTPGELPGRELSDKVYDTVGEPLF
jgi:hypothetical protein